MITHLPYYLCTDSFEIEISKTGYLSISVTYRGKSIHISEATLYTHECKELADAFMEAYLLKTQSGDTNE